MIATGSDDALLIKGHERNNEYFTNRKSVVRSITERVNIANGSRELLMRDIKEAPGKVSILITLHTERPQNDVHS